MPCFCLDLDGTLYKGSKPIKYAAEFLSKLNKFSIKHIAITNCPERSAQGVSERLSNMGIKLSSDNVLTAGMTAASVLKSKGVGSVYVLGSNALKEECERCGIKLGDDNVEAVLIGHSKDISYNDIMQACVLTLGGAELYCTNPDNTIPQGDTFIPHSGSIAAAVECATGRRCVYIGKPATYMMDDAIKMMSCAKDDIFMVGDRLDTDIMFGINCGVKTCLVLTGTTTSEMVADSHIKPDFVFNDLNELYNELVCK